MMRRAIAGAVAAVGLAWFVSAAVISGNALQPDELDDTTGPPPVSAISPSPADDPIAPPEITEDDKATTLAAIDEYLTTTEGLKNLEYTVSEIGPWTTDDGALIGTAVLLSFTGSPDVQARLPALEYDKEADKFGSEYPYAELIGDVSAQDVSEAFILVHLPSKTVVSVEMLRAGATSVDVNWVDEGGSE